MTTGTNITVLFDFDGTIADTLDPIIDIYNTKIAPKFNTKPIEDEHREMLKTKRPQEMMRRYNVSLLKLPFMVMAARKELAKTIDGVRPLNGMPKVIRALHDAGHSIGIITSNSRENVSALLKRFSLNDSVDFLHTGRHAFGKHRIIRKVIKSRGLDPSHVVMVGDEMRDLEAGQKAGIKTIGVTWGFNSRVGLERVTSHALVDTTQQLQAALEQLAQSRA